MLNSKEILDTIRMIDQQHLDIRTITMGISLLDCADPDSGTACRKIYDKICRRLLGEEIPITDFCKPEGFFGKLSGFFRRN